MLYTCTGPLVHESQSKYMVDGPPVATASSKNHFAPSLVLALAVRCHRAAMAKLDLLLNAQMSLGALCITNSKVAQWFLPRAHIQEVLG